VASPAEDTQDQVDDKIDNFEQDGGNESDKDSDLLSEIDEDQFDEYDPTTENRPVDIDENVAKTLKAAKRKRTDSETTKKPKEGRRPKKRSRGDDDVDIGENEFRERRPRKSRTDGEERRAAKKDAVQKQQEEEANLPPEERRRRALDRAIDAAVKNPSKRRRKKDDIVYPLAPD